MNVNMQQVQQTEECCHFPLHLLLGLSSNDTGLNHELNNDWERFSLLIEGYIREYTHYNIHKYPQIKSIIYSYYPKSDTYYYCDSNDDGWSGSEPCFFDQIGIC